MTQNVLVGLGAGAAAALLFASVASGALVSILLFYLAPLPILIAALGWSHWSGLLAAVTAAACLGLAFGALRILIAAAHGLQQIARHIEPATAAPADRVITDVVLDGAGRVGQVRRAVHIHAHVSQVTGPAQVPAQNLPVDHDRSAHARAQG